MYTQVLYAIYKLQQDRKVPTKDLLLSLGITEEQITGAIANNIIFSPEPNIYKLASVKTIYQFGLDNLLQGNKRTAVDIFELCYLIKPKHRETCLQLLYNAVYTGNYPKAYEYLYALENVSTNEHLRKDYKIYLYLLSKVSPVPEHYQEKLQAIQQDRNLLIHKKPKGHQGEENRIMKLILDGKYKFAIQTLNDALSEDYEYTLHRVIIKSLLKGILNLDEQTKKSLLDKVKGKRYREILTTLDTIGLERPLRIDEQNIYAIVDQIIKNFETGTTPEPIENEAKQVTEAIRYFDYNKALDLESSFLDSKDLPREQSHIYLLLVQITQQIYNMNRLEKNGISAGQPLTGTTL